MENYFSVAGLELKKRQIRAQEERVRSIGRLAGEEAGIRCDWHDNFGYEDAKRRLEMESTTLRQLRQEIAHVRIVTAVEQNSKIAIGVTARLLIDDEEKEYTVGAFGESDPSKSLITYNSPLGKLLLGMTAGDSKRGPLVGKTVTIDIIALFPPSHRYNDLIAQLVDKEPPSI